MLKELYEAIKGDATNNITVHETNDERHVLVSGELKALPKSPPCRSCSFSTVASLIAYLKDRNDGKTDVELFVGKSKVWAIFNPTSNHEDVCEMFLRPSEEYEAMLVLEDGKTPQELFKLLRTSLAGDGCMDPQLLMAVSNIQLADSSETNWKMDAVGIASGGSERKIRLRAEVNGKECDVSSLTDWTWKGRIWECFDNEYPVQLAMLAELKPHLTLSFTPARLQTVLRQAQADLIELLKAGVPENVRVYAGE